MGELNFAEMEKLILGYEELEPEDRALADRYLQSHPELARRLKWHQDKEAAAAAELPVAGEPWDGGLSPEDRQAQQDSLRRVLANLDLPRGAVTGREDKVPGFSDHLRRSARWILPLAAVLALAMLLPRGGDRTLLDNLTVVRIELMPDGSRGPALPAPGSGVLHTGQAFALDFHLEEDSYVVVYHVGPAGRVSRVYPEAITDTLSPHSGGQGHQIPSPENGEAWILGSETGTESFLVAVSRQLPGVLDQQVRISSGLDRAQLLKQLRSQLDQIMDQVDLHEFRHVD